MSARVPRVTHKHNRRRKQTRPPVQKLAPPPICPTACACCPSRPMHARRRVATHTRPGHCAPACPSLPTLSRPPAQGGAAKRTTGRSRARGPCSHTSSRLRAPCTPGATPAGAARLEATDDALVVGPMRTAGAGSARSRLARVGGRACAWVFVRQMNENPDVRSRLFSRAYCVRAAAIDFPRSLLIIRFATNAAARLDDGAPRARRGY